MLALLFYDVCVWGTFQTRELLLLCFQLTGLPVNIGQRPRGCNGRASHRALSVTNHSLRRPMSVIPTSHHQADYTVWRRPQSADHTSLPTRLEENFHSTAEHFHDKRYFPTYKDTFNNSMFGTSPLQESSTLSSLSENTDRMITPYQSFLVDRKAVDSSTSEPNHCTDYLLHSEDTMDFNREYSCPEMLDRTWTEEELIRYCDEVESEGSLENLSESSLGEQILTMAQADQSKVTSLLEPGLKNKPPLPFNSDSQDLLGSTESLLSARLQEAERETDLLLNQLVERNHQTSKECLTKKGSQPYHNIECSSWLPTNHSSVQSPSGDFLKSAKLSFENRDQEKLSHYHIENTELLPHSLSSKAFTTGQSSSKNFAIECQLRKHEQQLPKAPEELRSMSELRMHLENASNIEHSENAQSLSNVSQDQGYQNDLNVIQFLNTSEPSSALLNLGTASKEIPCTIVNGNQTNNNPSVGKPSSVCPHLVNTDDRNSTQNAILSETNQAGLESSDQSSKNMLMLIDMDQVIDSPKTTIQRAIPTYEEIIGSVPASVRESEIKDWTKDCNPDNISTYNDIVNILKVLESEEDKPIHCWQALDDATSSNITYLLPECHPQRTKQESLHTSSNITDVFAYLDKIDRGCSNVSEKEVKCAGDASIKLEDLLSMSVVDLAHMVFTLRFQTEDKTKSVKALKAALKQEREERLQASQEAEKNLKLRLSEQRDHYENTVSRHQKFIDQLIVEKKALAGKFENVLCEMKSLEERHVKKLKVIEERHAIEVQRAKDTQAAANKMRMESWVNTKTKKIKELTVKGLEPEMIRMTTSHQQELSELRQLHQHELKEVELRAARKAESTMELLRQQLCQEKEDALDKERDLLKQRIAKQAEHEDLLYQEHRHRLLNEIQREKQRLEREFHETKHDDAKAIERLKLEHQEALDTASRKHMSELRRMKEASEAEREVWMRDFKKQKDVEANEREVQCREELRRERDKQIELVIDRLTEEATQAKAALEQTANNKIRKLKEKFEADLREAEESEHTAKAKYTMIKTQLGELEDKIAQLKTANRQLEKELTEERKISESLTAERSHVKDVIRQEFSTRTSTLEQELARLRSELATSATKFSVELATFQSIKEHEMQAVYARVKSTIAQRDASIEELTAKCKQLEALVEAQRKEFLLK